MAACIALALGAGLGGCVSTQRKNARAELVADRTLAGRDPLRVHAASRDVHVTGVALVRGRRVAAVVVALRNDGAHAATDVPVAVDVRGSGGRLTRLNGGGDLGWFATHVPAIGAHARATWVFTTRRALPAGRAFALAGVPSRRVRSRASGSLPQVAATVAGRDRGGALRVALVNRSDVPQYDLQVYAVVRDGGRIVAAGGASLVHLSSFGRAYVRLTLVGSPGRRPVRVSAPPTIFD